MPRDRASAGAFGPLRVMENIMDTCGTPLRRAALIACAAVNAAAMAVYLYLTCRQLDAGEFATNGYAVRMAVGYLTSAAPIAVLGVLACAGFVGATFEEGPSRALRAGAVDACLGLMFLACALGMGFSVVGLVGVAALAVAAVGTYAALRL